ncbi:MAG: molybdopterin-dependent oxidoreductase, partial [Paracoccaceae bacterium]|nr:molybdopterin-dependent oxidoreductase [Paracoccaceae bacterium]
MGRIAKIARRTFLLGSVAVIGGVAFGYWKYKQPYGNPLDDRLTDGEASLTPYVKVASDGITIITPRAEMGQGVHTTLAAMVAEELDVELDAVKIEHGPASYAYYNEAVLEEAVPFLPTDHGMVAETMRGFTKVPAKFLALQITGGSSTTPDGFVKMRKAGAVARTVLVQAAAQKLGVSESNLKTENGHVIAPDGTKVAYTELATLAASIEPPADPDLKPQSEWRLLGKSQPRVDMVSKVTGTAPFGVDTQLDDMLYATVRVNPYLGAGIRSYDASETLGMRGVKKVVEVTNGLAVIATNTWYAMEGAKALEVEWEPAPYPLTTDEHFAQVAASFTDERQDSQNRNEGDVEPVLAGGNVTEIEYRAPYLAHATMEPMNATAWLRDGKLDIWA